MKERKESQDERGPKNMFPTKNRSWWTKGFDPEGIFENDIAHAIPIEAEWRLDTACSNPSWTVSILGIPGWTSPLWGTDDHFIYFRRPEGVWKTRIPEEVQDEMTLLLVRGYSPSHRSGTIPLADDIRCQPAWHGSMGFLRSPLDIDNDRAIKDSPGYAGAHSADFLGPALCRFSPDSDASRLIVEAEDDFDRPPTFSRNQDWLFATDSQSSRVVAYSLEQSAAARKALDNGALWLRYAGPFLSSFIVNAACISR